MEYALVTGGTKGIGKAIVKDLLRKGYFVLVTYSSDDEAANRFKIELEAYQDCFQVYKADQSDVQQVYSLVNTIKENTPYINCIICNAGRTLRKNFQDIQDEEWNAVMNVTLNSHFIIIRELFDRIALNSRVVFIGSLMGVHPHATSLAYGVSKAAVHALAKNLVKEFEGSETTVNVIVPGFVETEWQKDKPAEIRQNIYNKTAIKRFASVEEIAKACMFCIENDFVNGSLIEVSGGYSFK